MTMWNTNLATYPQLCIYRRLLQHQGVRFLRLYTYLSSTDILCGSTLIWNDVRAYTIDNRVALYINKLHKLDKWIVGNT